MTRKLHDDDLNQISGAGTPVDVGMVRDDDGNAVEPTPERADQGGGGGTDSPADTDAQGGDTTGINQ